MRLKTKLTLWSCSTVVLILIVTLITWSSVNRLLGTTEYVIHSSQMIKHSLLLEKYLERLEINIRNFTIFRDKKFKKQYEKDKKRLRNELRILMDIVWTQSQKEMLKNIGPKIKKWLYEADKFIVSLQGKGKNDSTLDNITRMKLGDKYLQIIRNKIRHFYNNEEKLMAQRKQKEAQAVNYTLSGILISSVAVIVIFAVISSLMSNRIRKPVDRIKFNMKEIADGRADLTKRIELEKNDEIGMLVKWFNLFIGNLQELVGSLKKEATALDGHSGKLSSSSIDLANESVSNSSAIEHMDAAMEDLKQATEVYYSNTTVTLEKNENNIQQLMENMDEATDFKKIKDIKNKLKEVSEFLVDMNKQATGMENFIDKIKEIGIQLRILSVNASVQASKAGEHGKGFSVIAKEIKNLSSCSTHSLNNAEEAFKAVQDASQKCSLTIEEIQNKTAGFIDRATAFSEDFMQKTELLGSISETINGLTMSRKKQLEGIRILAEAMKSIKDSSGNNAEAARKLEAASVEINELSKNLKEKTADFIC
ncbi:MAG: methyl-accepting chemotaxis protein [Victivallales bacterium]|nr:methyl-accepting chemotaxis protein [Victivallales bacterium]